MAAQNEANRDGAQSVAAGQSPRRTWETADTIVAVTIAFIAVVFAILGFLVWQAMENSVTQATERAQRAAQVLSERTRLVVGSALSMLDLVADSQNLQEPMSDAEFSELVETFSRLPANVALGIYDATGRSVSKEPDLPEEIAGARYFAVLASGREWTVDTFAETADFVVARRLSKDLGFSGALLLKIDHAVLSSFWSLMNLGDGSTVSVIRDDGVVVARYPPLEAPLDLSGAPVFATLMASDTGSYLSERSPADGVSRIVGFRHVPNLGLIAVAGLTTDATRAAIWTATGIVLALLGPIALALLGGSLATARVLRRSETNRRELAAALAHNEVLFKEIHHRVKNNLQSVNALLQLQPIPKEIRRDMGRRIAAMSSVHEHIYRSGKFKTVAVRDHLRTLLRDIESGQGAIVEIDEHIEDVSVDKDTALPLTLIVNEVLSNAFKHAFVDGRKGKISLTLVRGQDGLGHLTVQDNGVGFDNARASTGIGKRLITALSEQIGGTATYVQNEGTRFDLKFPLAPAR